jgi:hypothetical protein
MKNFGWVITTVSIFMAAAPGHAGPGKNIIYLHGENHSTDIPQRVQLMAKAAEGKIYLGLEGVDGQFTQSDEGVCDIVRPVPAMTCKSNLDHFFGMEDRPTNLFLAPGVNLTVYMENLEASASGKWMDGSSYTEKDRQSFQKFIQSNIVELAMDATVKGYGQKLVDMGFEIKGLYGKEVMDILKGSQDVAAKFGTVIQRNYLNDASTLLSLWIGIIRVQETEMKKMPMRFTPDWTALDRFLENPEKNENLFLNDLAIKWRDRYFTYYIKNRVQSLKSGLPVVINVGARHLPDLKQQLQDSLGSGYEVRYLEHAQIGDL